MNRGHYTNPRVPPAGSPGLLRKAGLSYFMIPRHFLSLPPLLTYLFAPRGAQPFSRTYVSLFLPRAPRFRHGI